MALPKACTQARMLGWGDTSPRTQLERTEDLTFTNLAKAVCLKPMRAMAIAMGVSCPICLVPLV